MMQFLELFQLQNIDKNNEKHKQFDKIIKPEDSCLICSNFNIIQKKRGTKTLFDIITFLNIEKKLFEISVKNKK